FIKDTRRARSAVNAFASSALFANKRSKRMFDLEAAFARDSNDDTKCAAMFSFHAQPWAFPDETCALLAQNLELGSDVVAGEAALRLAASGMCHAHYDALPAAVERRWA